MTQAELIEQADRQYACQKVLADLGNPVGAYVEGVQKETLVLSSVIRDYWRILVIFPDLSRMVVQFPAADLPCEACGTPYPASTLLYGACGSCWSAVPYALPFSM